MKKTNTLDALKKEKRWVVWNFEKVNGRETKVPYSIRGRKASSTDPATWATYDQVKKAEEFFSGIGIVFTPAQTLLGIDIDHVLENKKIVGDARDAVADLIKAADTYCEISPSGTGLHLYLGLAGPLALAGNKHAPFELYTSGRFFTFTEESYGKAKPVRTVAPEEAAQILAAIGYPWAKPAAADRTPSGASLLSMPRFGDEEIPARMFGSKNGEVIRALWDGDASAYKGDISRADAALLNHLAFWTGKDAAQMERLWVSSPLGAREKTKKRADYRTRSIDNAIAACKQVYEAPIDHSADIEFLMTKGAKGEDIITQNTENVCRILRAHAEFRDTLRHDVFSNVFEIKDPKSLAWRPFEDVDAIHMQTRISTLFPFFRRIGKDMVYDAILKVLNENAYDSAIDFITGIEWDKKPRIDAWLSNVYGVPDDIYHKAVGSNWLKGLVKRLVEPGCKFDYVLVLEGEQGVKKSTSLHILGQLPNGRSMHVETTMSTDSKDFFMQFSGKAIVEFSEGETLSRTEVKKMKAIITMQSDKYRPPYSRVSQDFPRRCVFAMTTNQDEYLKDETGNRRWLPVRVVLDKADIAWLEANRDQLFAEAYHRVVALKETVYEFPEEETRAQQDARRISDPNEEKIVDWYLHDQFTGTMQQKLEQGITIEMVYRGALSGFGPMKKHEEMAIADVLARVLKLNKRRHMVEGVQSVRWFNDNVLDLARLDAQPAGEFTDDDLPFGGTK